MNKIRVLHVLNSKDYAGAENVVINMINSQITIVDSLYLALDGSIKERLIEENVKFKLVNKISIVTIFKTIIEFKPHIIHAHDFTCSILCSCFSFFCNLISHIHQNPYFLKNVNIKSVLYYLSTFFHKRIIFVSKAIYDDFCFTKYINDEKICILNNPINKKRIISCSKEEFLDKFDIAFLGRLVPDKDPLRFMRIVLKLKKMLKNISVIIIGDGLLKNDIIEFIRINNLQNNVKVMGYENNPYKILKKCRILCSTSKNEGYGLVAAEALLLGIPVVCSNVGGLKYIINDDCGHLCNDDDEFVSHLILLLTNNEYYNNKSTGAIKRSNEILDISEYSKLVCDLYRGINE